jgi:hypothetical protein
MTFRLVPQNCIAEPMRNQTLSPISADRKHAAHVPILPPSTYQVVPACTLQSGANFRAIHECTSALEANRHPIHGDLNKL